MQPIPEKVEKEGTSREEHPGGQWTCREGRDSPLYRYQIQRGCTGYGTLITWTGRNGGPFGELRMEPELSRRSSIITFHCSALFLYFNSGRETVAREIGSVCRWFRLGFGIRFSRTVRNNIDTYLLKFTVWFLWISLGLDFVKRNMYI